jgi:hypothetical protein
MEFLKVGEPQTFLAVDCQPFGGEDLMDFSKAGTTCHFKPSRLIANHSGGKPNGLFEGGQAVNLLGG